MMATVVMNGRCIDIFPGERKGIKMKILVAHYSRTGSNRYLAERAAVELEADLEGIRPVVDLQPLILLGTWLGIGPGIRRLEHDPKEYDRVVVIAPLYLGKFALPAQKFVRRYSKCIREMFLATCCGSTYEKRNDKFGYESAFRHIRKVAGGGTVHCEAFSIGLVIPPEKQDDSETFMNTSLSDGNFKGEILEKFEGFIEQVKE
jgi:menaquinone-dependent protoporphyrinogen IX oxidase